MIFRKATRKDLPAIVALLANDILGKTREEATDPLPAAYYDAFEKIDEDRNQELIVGEDEHGAITATLQLTFLHSLTYRGGVRALIEAVRVHEHVRGQGVGQAMILYAVERAQSRKAHVVQLTSDKRRPDAIRFYERLGFVASHEGMKLQVS